MRNLLLLFICLLVVTACQKERLDNTNPIEEITSSTSTASAPQSALRSPAVITRYVDELNLCFANHRLNNVIPDPSSWQVGDNSTSGFIDYDLEQAFNCAPRFMDCTSPLQRIHIRTVVAEFRLADEGYVTIVPGVGNQTVYDYLSTSISTAVSDEIKQHFGCEIKNYQNANFPLSTISKIDFSSEALLCTCPSGQSRFVNAIVTFLVYA